MAYAYFIDMSVKSCACKNFPLQ